MKKTLEMVLSAHSENYDTDCQQHYGCFCGVRHPFVDDPGGRFYEISDWWAGHVADIIMEWMAEAGYGAAPSCE